MSVFIQRINHIRVSAAKHGVSAYASQSAFFILVAFFPFTMLVLVSLRYVPFTENEFLNLLISLVPVNFREAVEQIVKELYQYQSRFLPLTIIAALWSSSKGIYALMKGMNIVYECGDKFKYFRSRAMAVLYTAVFLTAMIFTIGLMLFGEWVITTLFGSLRLRIFIIAIRIITQIILLTALFTAIYYFFPAKRIKLYCHMPGAVISACGWVIFTELYSIYASVANTDIYASLGSVVLSMLWLYVCMYILLIGAEINVFLKSIDM